MGERIAHVRGASEQGIWKCASCGRSRVPREGTYFFEVAQGSEPTVTVTEHLFVDEGQKLPEGYRLCNSRATVSA